MSATVEEKKTNENKKNSSLNSPAIVSIQTSYLIQFRKYQDNNTIKNKLSDYLTIQEKKGIYNFRRQVYDNAQRKCRNKT